MTDPINEIISMSNDDSITKEVIEDDDKTDDDEDDTITDDEGEGGDKHKKVDKKHKNDKKKYSESPKKKEGKINKKKLSRELQNNKLRQIKVSVPYTTPKENDKVIDYNKSEQVKPKQKKDYQEETKKGKSRKWIKVVGMIVVGILCIIVIAFVTMKLYIHLMKKEARDNPLSESGNGETSSTSSETIDSSKEEKESYDKMIDDIGKGIKGGNNNKTKCGNNNKKSGPLRDAKGRFVSRKHCG